MVYTLDKQMLEPIENQYQVVGHIVRSHGVHGEIVINPEVETPQLFENIDLVRIKNTRGDLVPARIESVRVQDKNNRLSFFVKFEHVTDRTGAEEIKNSAVYANRGDLESLNDPGDEPVDLTSFDVMSNGKKYGTVETVIDNPAHPILNVVTADQEQLLIPFVDEYIIALDEENQVIECQNLDQLADLKQ